VEPVESAHVQSIPATGPRVHLVAGTRPEAVKIAPLVAALTAAGLIPVVVDTGQQPGRVAEALAPFGLRPDIELGLQRRDGGLPELVALTTTSFDAHLSATQPAAVLVQGDTTTAFAVGLTAHLRGVPLVHLEAGLRTYDRANPFPEESNRTLLADLADLHLAPTPRAAAALSAEGVRGPKVIVTGNTVVDALQVVLPAARARHHAEPDGRLLVVTVHRREAWGAGVRTVARSVAQLLAADDSLRAVVVTHPNPAVAGHVHAVLDGVERCELLPPLPYDDMLALLVRADAVLTDSGGIQEEAPTIGVKVVVAREVTERPEGVDSGWAVLTGLDPDRIVKEVGAVLAASDQPRSAAPANPYGDGRAAERSAAAIAWLLGRGARPADWAPAGPAAR
jgi:UDP-N-acetylglucosamine 2-epimerase (non-hydrolysing)